MKTIEKVLWYKPYSEAFLEQERRSWNFNWMWTDEVNLDDILKMIIDKSFGYDPSRGRELYRDLQNLFYRHDQEYRLRLWKIVADYRLAKWCFLLLHWTKLRWIIAPAIFFSLVFNKEARRTYNAV